MEEGGEGTIEVESMEVLIILGFDVDLCELSIEEGVVALGGVEI